MKRQQILTKRGNPVQGALSDSKLGRATIGALKVQADQRAKKLRHTYVKKGTYFEEFGDEDLMYVYNKPSCNKDFCRATYISRRMDNMLLVARRVNEEKGILRYYVTKMGREMLTYLCRQRANRVSTELRNIR